MTTWIHRSIRIAAASLLVSSVALSAAPLAKPIGKPIAPAAPKAVAAHHVVVNSHLHLKPAATTKTPTAGKATKTAVVARHYGTSHFHFAEWATLHRGTTTVTGVVTGKNGAAVAGARVALRGPKGRILGNVAARHVTATRSDGAFVMRNVRIGSYRVRASKGKPNGHVNVVLHGGQTSTVQVKI